MEIIRRFLIIGGSYTDMNKAEKENKRLVKKSNKRGMGWFNGSHPHNNNDDLELTKGGYVNIDAGNVPAAIQAFNSSSGDVYSANSSCSVAEALYDLNHKEVDRLEEQENMDERI